VLDERRVAWGAVSRAIRTPARHGRDSRIVTGPFVVGPSPDFGSEELLAYELGYRTQATDEFSWDVALYYNVYDGLRSTASAGGNQYFSANEMDGHTVGCEVSGTLQLSPCWRMQGWYAFSNTNATEPFTPVFPKTGEFEGKSPDHQAFLMSSWDVGCQMEFDVMARYVDYLPSNTTPSYFSLDMRLGWRPTCHLEFSVVAQNLLDDQHKEFSATGGAPQYVSEIRRGVYGQVVYRY
jgi:iron complex outermembrane receptor protein